MKIILSLAFTFIAAVAFAQDVKNDTANRYKPNQPIDTAMANEYGMRLYDTRMTRYLAPDTAYKQNPYYFANKKRKHKKSR
jgi:hypothetical protein